MSPTLREELKQRRPWASLEEEAALNILRTAAVFEHLFSQTLRPHGITMTQYNVLRILRGAGERGLCRQEIGERLIRSMPDVTRLLDRLEEMGLLARCRDEKDRRFVTTVITPAGLTLLGELDRPTTAFHRQWLGHLTVAEQRGLIASLEHVRAGADRPRSGKPGPL